MTAHALRCLVGAELRMIVRDTAGLVIPIALPLLTMVSNALALDIDAVGAYLLPLVLVIVIATIGVVNAPSFLATYRRTGVLRRLAVTPLHPAAVLAAQLIAGLVQIAVGALLACAVAVLAFSTPLPARPVLTVAVLLLATLALYAVGLVVAALAPSASAAVAIGLVLFFAMSSIGGMFGPVGNLPAGVAAVGEALPFGAALPAVVAAWNGSPMPAGNLVSLGVATLLCTAVAVRWFRWS